MIQDEQDNQQKPDNEASDLDKVTAGTDIYKGFLLDNVLHSDGKVSDK